MGAEQDKCAVGNFGKIFDELGSLRAQSFHDAPVMHDLMSDVDRRSEQFKCLLDGGNGTLDSGAETTDVGDQNFHFARLPDLQRETVS
jgi:hypothetical protein